MSYFTDYARAYHMLRILALVIPGSFGVDLDHPNLTTCRISAR